MGMHLAVVSNVVPDGRPLSEHAYHLVRGLRRSRSEHRVTVVSGRWNGADAEAIRRWEYGSPWIARQMVDGLRDVAADAVLFNAHFTAWGSNVANLGALLAPLLASRSHERVLTLLHHLPHTIDARRIGYRLTPFHRAAIDLACHALARAGTVLFTNERDRAAFERYRPRRSVVVPLGLQGDPIWGPPARAGHVLTFGSWGRGKDPVAAIRAALASRRGYPLVVAGGSSHTRAGYMEELRARYAGHERVRFTGYVPEADVPTLFRDAAAVVLPYRENTGVSSVLMQTCQYGRVPILTRLPLFESLVERHGFRAHFYAPDDDPTDLIDEVLGRPAELEADGYHNYEASRRLAMPVVAPEYWSIVEDGHRADALPAASRAPAGSLPVTRPAQLHAA